MKKIKLFQRSMIVLLVSINVLFYCIKTNQNLSLTFTYTVASMLASLLGIYIYRQSGRRITKISMAKVEGRR